MPKKLFYLYLQLPIKYQILFPLLFIFLSIWTVGNVSLGLLINRSLEQNLKEETQELSTLVKQAFEKEKQMIRFKSRWVADSQMVSQAVTKNDKSELFKSVIPLKKSLDLDFISIVDEDNNVLVQFQDKAIEKIDLEEFATNQFASLGINYSAFVGVNDGEYSLLVGVTSVKSRKGIEGGVIVGKLFEGKELNAIRSGIKPHLVIFHNGEINATTLRDAKLVDWKTLPENSPPFRVSIAGRNYFAKSIKIPRFNGELKKLVLLNPLDYLEYNEKKVWWNIFIFSTGGAVIFTFSITALTKLLTTRIAYLTNTTKKMALGDFSEDINVTGNDEIGILAQGFSFMSQQIQLLLKKEEKIKEELELYNQVLEFRVQERTQELDKKNSDLQTTLDKLKLTQIQMIQSEKMSALGQMVAGVAHEINNPVGFVYGNLAPARDYAQDLISIIELYQKHYPEPEPEIKEEIEAVELDFLKEDFTRLLESMQVGTERIREIVLSLRNFSRLDEADFKHVDIHEGIDSTLMILQNRLKYQPNSPEIAIIKEYKNLPPVECYPSQLNQVFMNILSNAIDALDEYNSKRSSEEIKNQPPHIKIITNYADGGKDKNSVEIRIIDNGSGISPKILSKLFDPFFTTKEVGKGTGLGLSISYQIITDKHGGKLSCHSVPGEMTEFCIQIPVEQV